MDKIFHYKQLFTTDELRMMKNSPLYNSALELNKKDLIKLNEKKYINCNNSFYSKDSFGLPGEKYRCNGKVLIDNLYDEEELVCPECGKVIEFNKSNLIIKYCSTINYKSIIKYIQNIIIESEEFNIKENKEGFFVVENESSKLINICIPSLVGIDNKYYYTFNYVWNKNPLFIKIKNYSISHIADNFNSIGIWDIINDSNNLIEKIKLASVEIEDNKEVEEIDKRFKEFVENITWQKFEDWVNEVLISHIKDKKKLVEEYLQKLERDKNKIYGYFPVKIGGAGNTDIRFIKKYSYLNNIIHNYENAKIWDAKRHSDSTSLSRDDMRKINYHLDIDPSSPDRAIIICTSNKIASTAWDSMFELASNSNEWKLQIIPKSLLIELLIHIDGIKLLEQYN
ncbi:MAG: hypothetical protein ACOCP8_08505 [archaeon]